MTELRIVGHAMWRELYSRRKAFLITTAITVFVVLGGVALAGRAATSNAAGDGVSVGVLGAAPTELEAEVRIRLAPDTRLEVVTFTDRGEGEAALRHRQRRLGCDANHPPHVGGGGSRSDRG